MEGLYNKVIKGHYPKIGDRYSSDISDIIKMLLKVNPSDRPTCAQILKHPIIKKRLEFFKANENIEDIQFNLNALVELGKGFPFRDSRASCA